MIRLFKAIINNLCNFVTGILATLIMTLLCLSLGFMVSIDSLFGGVMSRQFISFDTPRSSQGIIDV